MDCLQRNLCTLKEVCNSLETPKEPEDLEELQGGEEVQLCDNSKPATFHDPSTRSKPKTVRQKQKRTKDVLGMRPEEKHQKPGSLSESTTLRPAPGKPKMEEGEESEQVDRRRRKPAGAGPKMSQVENVKKENVPASRSRKRGAAEGPAPRRSKRIASKK